MNRYTFVPRALGWVDAVLPWMVRRAAHHAPEELPARLEEEWSADLSECSGLLSRLRFTLGCWYAISIIRWDHRVAPIASTSVFAAEPVPATGSYRGPPLYAVRPIAMSTTAPLCDINTTPLIDVMLVLLTTLIVTLPIMTHSVVLDMPRASPDAPLARPDMIDVDIDIDGSIAWNGAAVADLDQLESYFLIAAQTNPQPEIRLRPDPHAKYDRVAKVLASAQRNRMLKISFVDTPANED